MAQRLLQGWLEWGGDYGGLPLLPWYLAYRAMVRAKVAALRLQQQGAAGAGPGAAEHERDLESYVEAARQAMAPGRGALLITHGVSGSGKSHGAAILRHRGWLQLRSDLERRRMFGRWGLCPAAPLEGDPYAAAISDRLYGSVLAEAAAAAQIGRAHV